MKDYIIHDEWNIIEEGFDPQLNKISESLFSIGNGRMGQRANFEEHYSGDSLQGSYIAGIYYPDKTRVGWWKNGYPEYFAKVLNAANWIGIDISIDGERLDLSRTKVLNFRRVLNMREGYLQRTFTVQLSAGKEVSVESTRFCSLVDDEAGAIRYRVTTNNFSGTISVTPYIDGDIKNKDANYDEKFWEEISRESRENSAVLTLHTKKTDFWVSTAMHYTVSVDNEKIRVVEQDIVQEKFTGKSFEVHTQEGQTLTLYKYVVNLSAENHPKPALESLAWALLDKMVAKGFDRMLVEQSDAWARKWEESDIRIEGDVAAQQAIRFNIFQLYQTYTGEDNRLNIGPKGFTGEKYGGSTYWDTEAYCLPFYLATAPQKVAKNLLVYRYKHLQKAIENAAKLGFGNGW